LGTQEPRKNFNRVISTFEKLNHNHLQLVIVGKYGWGNKNLKLKVENLKLLGYVPDEDLAPLYSGAVAFVYPSLYEGFGMPVVEAQACGCPVITSNTSSMPEAAGEGAILINPENEGEIVQALEKIIQDQPFRTELIRAGEKNAKKFSWKKSAERVLDVIEAL